MSEVQEDILWEPQIREKYEKMIKDIPLFHRDIAKKVVDVKAVINAKERGASQVEEGDVVRAFFSEVPMTFYSLMVRLLQRAGFEYEKYEE